MQWLKSGEEFKEGILFLGSLEVKFYQVIREIFVLGLEGILIKEKVDKYLRWLMVFEWCCREILELFYDILVVEYQGV